MVNNVGDIDTKIEIIGVADNIYFHFIYVPAGYTMNKVSLQDREVKILGRLNQFNRLKLLSGMKKKNGDLVKIFTDALLSKGWDFKKFPNPCAYVSVYKK